MNNFPSRDQVALLREQYPPGTRIELIATLDDPYAKLKPGDRATVTGIDDAGHILCHWDYGSSLSLISDVDHFKVIPYISDTVFEQIMEIRKHPDCPNMFDTKAVFTLAIRLSFDELADFIFTDAKRYSTFILTGDRDA